MLRLGVSFSGSGGQVPRAAIRSGEPPRYERARRGSIVDAVEQAAHDGWSHAELLTACLEREVATRQAHGAENRIKAPRFAAHKTLEDFDFKHQRSIRREAILHLGAGARRSRSWVP